jgi:sec-independent protein translocase protein TatC
VTTVPEDDEIEASRAPLMEHLVELRARLIVCAWALGIGFAVSLFFAKSLYGLLVVPAERAAGLRAMQLQPGARHGTFDLFLGMIGLIPVPPAKAFQLIATAPLESFFTQVKLAGFGAVVIAFPVLAWQLYRFVAPGLYKRERNAFLPFLIASPVLFLMGASLVYFIMLPFVMWFSLSQQFGDTGFSVQLMPKVSEYLSLVTTLLLAFGLCFQLPVVVALLGLAGMVTSQFLAAGRRYAIVGVFAVAAVLTPPDPISMMSLAIPGVLLYEISIWCVWLIERRRKREDEAAGVT